ncbi:MAG: hypothetical protein QXP36_15300 [Conexivisphaerales archaeon]
MSKIISESSNLETVVTPFIDAANTTYWKHALNILYINGAVLEIPEGTGIPCLISQTAPAETAKESIDLLQSRAQTKLTPILMEWAKNLIANIIIGKETTYDKEQTTNDTQIITFISKVSTELKPQLEQLQKRAPSLFYKSASSIFELITASLFKTIAEIRTAQLSCGIREDSYENMINALLRLELIQPAIQVSICPKCANYQLTLSQCPPSTINCSKCGEKWTTQTVYLFKGQLSQIKAQNLDLPLFISSYLKFKIIPLTILAEIEVYPNAIIETQTADKEKAEIDVYIPDLQAGIECKTYTDPTAPMTTQRLNGIVGDIMRKHIEKYLKANIENIFIVTNLPENHTQKLENALKNATEKQGIRLKTLKVIPGKIESLLQFLDDIAKDITNKISIFRES